MAWPEVGSRRYTVAFSKDLAQNFVSRNISDESFKVNFENRNVGGIFGVASSWFIVFEVRLVIVLYNDLWVVYEF